MTGCWHIERQECLKLTFRIGLGHTAIHLNTIVTIA